MPRDTDAKERFVQQARAAAALNHPNICTIHEIDGQSFIVIEYIEGQSLREKIESGPLDVDEAVDIAVQAAEGLRKVHETDIVMTNVSFGRFSQILIKLKTHPE